MKPLQRDERTRVLTPSGSSWLAGWMSDNGIEGWSIGNGSALAAGHAQLGLEELK